MPQNIQETFCLLKSEAHLLGKQRYIKSRIEESGFVITEKWAVRLTFGDVFRMYKGWTPRIATLLRFPPLFKLDMYLLKGHDAIHQMYHLKHQIRREIWGFQNKKGGFLHAPDSISEAQEHRSIIEKRVIRKR